MTGSELRAYRLKLGLSQDKLSKILGVAMNTVARWERGEQAITHPEMVWAVLELEGQKQAAKAT